MSTKTKVRTFKRCIKLCRKQLDNIKSEIASIELEEEKPTLRSLMHSSSRWPTANGPAKTFEIMPVNVTSTEEVRLISLIIFSASRPPI